MNRVLFALALRSRDALELTRLIRNDSDFYQGNLALAIRLWQNDLPAVALALLARPGEYHAGIPGISGNATPLQFSREIEAGLTPWLATIEDPSQRFRIECLISCLPDAEGDPAPEHKRFERVEALVKRFPAEVPKARVSRNEILAALATETGPARALANEYDEAVGKETLGSLQSIREEDSRNPKTIGSSEVMKTLIRHSMQYALEERGDATVFLRHLKSLNVAAVGNQQSRATQVMRELAPWYSALLVRRMVGLPAEERAEPARQALEITRNLLEWEGVDRDSLIVSLAVTSQAAAGDGAALDRWVETLPPLLKTRYSSWWSGNRPYASIGILRQPAFSGKEFEKSRLALIAAMLGDSATLAREMRPDTAVSEFISHFPLQPADVIAVIDLIPENNPRRAEFLALKALHLGRMDGKEEETLAIFAAAETAAAGNDKQLDSVRAAHVMYLVRRPDRRDDALVIAKTINLDNLAPQERRSLEAHLKRFAPKEPKE